MADKTFSWLHLSDLHVGMVASSYLWPNVEDIILDDLEYLHEKCGPWDAIFFTGDLVQKGSRDEFAKFNEVLGHIRERLLRLGSDPIFVAVPGNHDLTRPSANGMLATAFSTWRENENIRNDFWSKADSDYRKGISKAFANWQQWVDDGGIDFRRLKDVRLGILPGDFAATIEIRGLSVGILGLNTAALQIGAGDYKGRLSLHPCQLQPLFPEGIPRWTKSHHANLLLTHHSVDWLDKQGRTTLCGEIAPPGKFALHLCGHQHEPVDLLLSQGGSTPRITLVGRSLFGLENWGETFQEERIHGYSTGIISFSSNRSLRVWPRTAYRQQAGHLRIDRDESIEKLQPDDGMEPRNLGPCPVAITSTPPSFTNVTLKGWQLLTSDFLNSHKRELSRDELELFFDGQEPGWPHALSDTQIIPRRRIVGDAFEQIVSTTTPVLIRILAAGGEGKSLALRQAAVQLVETGFHVLFREDEGDLNTEEIVSLPAGGKWVLITDDADRIASKIYKTIKALRQKGRTDISWIVAARDTDWFSALRQSNVETNWATIIKEWPRREELRRFITLTEQEAATIVSSWSRSDSLGALANIPEEKRAYQLFVNATSKGDISDATLFGGILQTRITNEGLVGHVSKLMARLNSEKLRIPGSTKKLYEAFLASAACDAVGIKGIDLIVLADMLEVPRTDRRALILHPLGMEAAATGSGSALRIRHPAIAKAALKVSATEFGDDIEELYKRIIQATINAGADGTRLDPYAEILNCGPTLVKNLNYILSKDEAENVAISVALFSEKSDPAYLATTVSLAGTYRGANRDKDAINALNLQRDKASTKRDWKENGRGYLYEYSVCKGRCGDKLASIWLSGASLADFSALDAAKPDHVKKALAGIGAACMDIPTLSNSKELLMTLRAVAVLGEAFSEDRKALSFFNRHKALADKLGAAPCSKDEAFTFLQGGIAEALKTISDAAVLSLLSDISLSKDGRLTFIGLKKVIDSMSPR